MTTFKEQVDPLYKSIVDGGAKNYNNILKLTNLYEAYNNDLPAINDGNEETMKNLRYLTQILYKIYYKLAVKLQLNPSMATNDKEAILYKWLRKNYDVNFKNKVLLYYINQLEQENSLSLDCIDIFMKCLELEATFFASKMGASYFPNKTLQKLVLILFKDSSSDKTYLVKHFSDKYYKKHADIQFYFQVELQSLFEESQENIPLDSKTNAGYWLELVNHDSNYDDKEADLDVFVPHPPTLMENENKFKTAFEDNWLNILSNGLITNEQFKSILTILHKRVIPRLKQPTKLMDFLTDCYDNESSDLSVKLLALNGLFNLMHMFNLEYPNFYLKLYALFTEELLHLKYRSRFIRLIELFLKSSHLSINLVASFIKRMARLLLTASPGAIVSVLPLIYNLLKLHPNCMILIHDPEFVPKNYELYDKVKNLKFIDPYDMTEVDPELTDAINSSLWEVDTLMDHYHPNVASLAKIFKQPFRKLNYNIEDFLDWNYKILLDNELKRKIKILPSLDLDVKTKGSKLFEDDSSYLKTIKW